MSADDSKPPVALVRCGGCGQPPADPARKPLRRGRCETCYEKWVRARPIGDGASCACCGDRRRLHLRHYELGLRHNAVGGRWVVLCHNCSAEADRVQPPPRSVEALKMRLYRDRRWEHRRNESIGTPRASWLERRTTDRRVSPRDVMEVEEGAILEIIAEYETISEAKLADIEEVTGVHNKIGQ
jgi:hypothetical protein